MPKVLRHRMAGVTLLELLTVITLAAILMAIAVPSYRSITSSYRISGEVNGLLGDLQFARAEAIKEGQNVTVCISTSGTDCAMGLTGWQNGWIVFSDPTGGKTTNGNGALVLRKQVPFSGGDTFDDSTTSAVFFDREGLITGLPGTGALIPLHDPTANVVLTRCLQMSNVGSMQVTQNSANGSCT